MGLVDIHARLNFMTGGIVLVGMRVRVVLPRGHGGGSPGGQHLLVPPFLLLLLLLPLLVELDI